MVLFVSCIRSPWGEGVPDGDELLVPACSVHPAARIPATSTADRSNNSTGFVFMVSSPYPAPHGQVCNITFTLCIISITISGPGFSRADWPVSGQIIVWLLVFSHDCSTVAGPFPNGSFPRGQGIPVPGSPLKSSRADISTSTYAPCKPVMVLGCV